MARRVGALVWDLDPLFGFLVEGVAPCGVPTASVLRRPLGHQ